MLRSPTLPPYAKARAGLTPIAPFGTYPMTRRQRLAHAVMHERLLGRGRLRRLAVSWFQHGPEIIDGFLFGYRVRFHPRDNQTDAKGAVCGALYNRRELHWLRRILSPDATFVDVGANMGFFSLYAAHCQTRRILAIEANPILIQRFQETLSLNQPLPIWTLACAVGATSDTGTLVPRHHDLGSGQIAPLSTEASPSDHPAHIPIRPLKDLVVEAGFKQITLMKLDIEGMEYRVLDAFFREASPSLYPQHIILERPTQKSAWSGLSMLLIQSGLYHIAGRTRANLLLSRQNPSMIGQVSSF